MKMTEEHLAEFAERMEAINKKYPFLEKTTMSMNSHVTFFIFMLEKQLEDLTCNGVYVIPGHETQDDILSIIVELQNIRKEIGALS